MLHPLKNSWKMDFKKFSRRELLRGGSLLSLPALIPGKVGNTIGDTGKLQVDQSIYQSIGVRPLINARGTYTIISGSLMLPEVRAAMDAAARHYVHLDELMEAIGRRLSELTKAEWGIVTSGCAAGLTHATAACAAGGNPDLHVRIPNLNGFLKDEVIIPKHSRNVYDAAVRAVGVRVIEVETVAELEAALGPRSAMIYILAGPLADESPLNTRSVAQISRQRGVPVLVDAAAEILTVPNVHLESGAALVGYSGGKCLRGPQSAGLLLGRKDLVQAAWIHSAPHHGFARSMKVGKEEAMGMLMAVEMWLKRDHQAEWDQWVSWLDRIANRVSAIDGVTASIVEPKGLSNRTPTLSIQWDQTRLGISGRMVAKSLLDSEPRIATSGRASREESQVTGISINPYMMSPGEDAIVADRLFALLSNPPRRETEDHTAPPSADLSGQWDIRIEFAAGSTNHKLHLRQQGNRIEGTHQGDFISRDLSGSIEGDRVQMSSIYTERHGDSLMFHFTGKVSGDEISGILNMEEYLSAKWSAKRHVYRKG